MSNSVRQIDMLAAVFACANPQVRIASFDDGCLTTLVFHHGGTRRQISFEYDAAGVEMKRTAIDEDMRTLDASQFNDAASIWFWLSGAPLPSAEINLNKEPKP